MYNIVDPKTKAPSIVQLTALSNLIGVRVTYTRCLVTHVGGRYQSQWINVAIDAPWDGPGHSRSRTCNKWKHIRYHDMPFRRLRPSPRFPTGNDFMIAAFFRLLFLTLAFE